MNPTYVALIFPFLKGAKVTVSLEWIFLQWL